jgi:hypothetical protein
MIKSLYIIEEKDEAATMFDKVLGYANHLALIDTAMTLLAKRIEEEDKLLEVLGTQER